MEIQDLKHHIHTRLEQVFTLRMNLATLENNIPADLKIIVSFYISKD